MIDWRDANASRKVMTKQEGTYAGKNISFRMKSQLKCSGMDHLVVDLVHRRRERCRMY